MANPTQTEATEHLERSWAEICRLRDRVSLRPKDEKKRLGQLEKLLPKLKRLTRSPSDEIAISKDETTLLASLKTPAA